MYVLSKEERCQKSWFSQELHYININTTVADNDKSQDRHASGYYRQVGAGVCVITT
jgi:hypothetical protein